jgi:fructokinase
MSGAGPVLGAVETGGTTIRVALGEDSGAIARRDEFRTRDPRDAVARIAGFFERAAGRALAAAGAAAFGPIDVDPASPDCGTLLSTPKPGWSRFPLRAELLRALRVPVAIDTDVNAAALAEPRAARAAGLDAGTLAYVTVGTGIGVGVALDGAPHHGALHPEAGHLRVQRAPGDSSAGCCPFHGDCLEGIASAPAIAARAGADPAALPADSDAWRIEADYLAQLCLALVGVLAPHRIVLGGGVGRASGLIETVRARAVQAANGYAPSLADPARASRLLVAPMLGADSGLAGALLLAAAVAPP